MDDLSINPDLANNLSDKDKKDLHQFIQGESQKANIQNMVHDLTGTSFALHIGMTCISDLR